MIAQKTLFSGLLFIAFVIDSIMFDNQSIIISTSTQTQTKHHILSTLIWPTLWSNFQTPCRGMAGPICRFLLTPSIHQPKQTSQTNQTNTPHKPIINPINSRLSINFIIINLYFVVDFYWPLFNLCLAFFDLFFCVKQIDFVN